MKQFLFFLGLISLIANGYGQDYRPMLVDGSRWYSGPFESPFDIPTRGEITGDSAINGKMYKKYVVRDTALKAIYLLREEVDEKRVYQFTALDSSDRIRYNFALPAGSFFTVFGYNSSELYEIDSITNYIPSQWNCPDPTPYLNIQNPRVVYLSHWYFHVGNPPIIWVEGIGALSGLISSTSIWGGWDAIEYGWEGLTCHYDSDGNQDYRFNYKCVEDNNCDKIFLSGDDLLEEEMALSIFPTPVTDVLNIKLDDPRTTIDQVFLYDLSGQLVNTYHVDPFDPRIDLSDLISGIYLLRIRLQDGRKITKKLIKQ